jgi:hypothetical protein
MAEANIPTGKINRDRSYFVFLEALEKPGCPICRLVLEDSRGYLDSLMYERILDVPTRLELMDSCGFCSWHTWQIPALPAICSPTVGFSICASDLLKKFDLLTRASIENKHKKRFWNRPLKKLSQKLFSRMKAKACPACVYVAQGESYYLRELTEFIQEDQFLSAYQRSEGICLRHFFSLEQSFANHPNFPALLNLQLNTVQSLRKTIDEFIRKQDHRFRDQITSSEAKVWRVVTEFLAGQPGVFNNEMGRGLVENRRDGTSAQEISNASGRLPLRELITKMNAAKEVTVYLKQPLSPQLFDALRECVSFETHPTISFVVEDFADVTYLRGLHAAGFDLFYGLGLPNQTVLLLNSRVGFVFEDQLKQSHASVKALKDPESLYFRLLWCRFGHAVLLSGLIRETDVEKSLFRLEVEGRDVWCRLKSTTTTEIPLVGSRVRVFSWEKWVTRILDVIELELVPANDAPHMTTS